MAIYKDDLERVYKLIEKPENWTQGVTARDADGNGVYRLGIKGEYDLITECQAPEAVSWCLIGAFAKFGLATGWEEPTRVLMPEESIERLSNCGGGAAHFNDNATHAEVLALLRSAIERAPVRP